MIDDLLDKELIEAYMLIDNFEHIGQINDYLIYARGYERIAVQQIEDKYSISKRYRSPKYYYHSHIQDIRKKNTYDIWSESIEYHRK